MKIWRKEYKVTKVLLISYIVLSVIYISISIFENTKQFIYNVWVQQWQEFTVNSIINQALNKECKSFRLFSWEVAVDLVNVKCLSNSVDPNQEN